MGGSCPIEEVVSDPETEHLLAKYLLGKTLYLRTELPELQKPMLEELGLLDDPESLLAIESAFAKWREYLRQQNKG